MTGVELGVLGAGLATLVIVTVDLFRTVLEYGGYGPVSRHFNRAVWSLARAAARRMPEAQRSQGLALAGPLVLVTTIGAWVVLTWIGFALVYIPFVPERFVYSVPMGPPVLDALYFSAVSLSTVGFGNIVAAHPALQLASALEALAGFTILTLTISYVLGVYGVLRTQSTIAALIDDRTDGSTEPVALATAVLTGSSPERELESLHRELVSQQEGIHRYPIVHYFRRRVDRRSTLYVLRMVGGAAASIRWGLSPTDSLTKSPILGGLLRAELRVIGDLRERLLGGTSRPASTAAGSLRDRFDAASELRKLRAESMGAGQDEEAFRAFADYVSNVDDVTRRAARLLAFDEREIGTEVRR